MELRTIEEPSMKRKSMIEVIVSSGRHSLAQRKHCLTVPDLSLTFHYLLAVIVRRPQPHTRSLMQLFLIPSHTGKQRHKYIHVQVEDNRKAPLERVRFV